ncbi:hypothetical protein VNO80_10033 [Phaseolus coccineus]|uniref:Uncharacterized protein n=1 Tax=Phaseolus coccineus TaxID=3886 RepID=A0AAN9N7Y4_PHACN
MKEVLLWMDESASDLSKLKESKESVLKLSKLMIVHCDYFHLANVVDVEYEVKNKVLEEEKNKNVKLVVSLVNYCDLRNAHSNFQLDDVAEWSGVVAVWLIPLHFSFAFQFPLQRFHWLFSSAQGYVCLCELNGRVRVANELGAGNGKGSKFAMQLSDLGNDSVLKAIDGVELSQF